MTDTDSADAQRRHLLEGIFGDDVPDAVDGQLLRTSDVAALFQVSERTVSEWARRGRIPSVRTPGGHRRYPAHAIRDLLTASHGGDLPAHLLTTVASMGALRASR
ncbi:MAG TPA: helix-turn-helix domain-containing protein [Acidimicrobiales bacterium]|nr:helix-turn-helix domain-containing protein [Acidimicrobiales bacterium]